jgi:hypothetical protein
MTTSSKIIDRNISLVLDSNGSQIIGQDPNNQSQFSVQFDEAIVIPKHALNPTLEVDSATIINNEPNFTVESTFTYNNRPLTVPIGNWGVSELEDYMNALIQTAPGTTADVITLKGIKAIAKIQITSTAALNLEDDFLPVLGFEASQMDIQPNTTTTGNLNAKVAALSYYLISSDILSDGIRFNNNYNSILAQIEITQQPGSAIIFAPINPALIPVEELKGSIRSRIQVRLLTSDLKPANTLGESWSCRVRIKWKELQEITVANVHPIQQPPH